MAAYSAHPRAQQWTATLWVHHDGFAKENVLFNRAAISSDIPPDALLSVALARTHADDDHVPEPFIFKAADLDPDYQLRHPHLQLSVSHRIASLYGLHPRTHVVLSPADATQHTASHIELAYRDVLLERSEMLRLCERSLNQQTLFQGQVISFVSGSINCTVKNIHVRGQRVRSALFTNDTRPVFRSETARFIILVQMSKEMWEFDPYGSGETLWTKTINDFLMELFDHWSKLKTRHLVTIVLFTRVMYTPAEHTEPHKDFYKVIASEVPSTDSAVLLGRMRAEYRNFLRSVQVQPCETKKGIDVIKGVLSTASQGCLLEAINLATSHFSKACNDPDLLRTEKSLLVVSPGVGLFEVERNQLRMTTERVICSGFGIDLVCLAHKPLHVVPIFAVKPTPFTISVPAETDGQVTPRAASSSYHIDRDDPQSILRQYSGWTFVKPSWIAVAFYQSKSQTVSAAAQRLRLTYAPSTRIPELQYIGSTAGLNSLQMAQPQEDIFSSVTDPDELNRLMDKADDSLFRIQRPQAPRVRSRPQTSMQHLSGSTDQDRDRDRSHLPRRLSRQASLFPPEKHHAESEAATGTSPERTFTLKTAPSKAPSELHSPRASHASRATSIKSRDASPAPSVSRSTISSRAFGLLRLGGSGLSSIGIGGVGIGKTAASTSATAESAEFDRPKFKRDKTERPGAIEEAFKASLSRNVSTPTSLTPTPSIADGSSSGLVAAPTRSAPIQISKRTESPLPVLQPHNDETGADKQGDGSTQASSWNVDRDEAFRTSSLSRKNASLEKRFLAVRNVPTKWDDLAPWLVTVHPSHPNLHEPSLFASWRHLFASSASEDHVKWKALTSPASLPLTTEECPRPSLLESDDYTKTPYSVAVEHAEDPMARGQAMLKLIHTRLNRGFQLCVGDRAVATGGVGKVDSRIFSPSFGRDDAVPIVMVRGNTVHVLSHDAGSITVTRYQRVYAGQNSGGLRYEPEISTLLDTEYHTRIFYLAGFDEENWNPIDNYLLRHHLSLSSSSSLSTRTKARWALLPTEIPQNRRNFVSGDDTDEEIRLEGIRKLTILWQRTKFYHLNGKEKSAIMAKNAELSPLAIEYATTDPSAYLAGQLENSPLLAGNQTVTSMRLHDGTPGYKSSSVDLHKLARDLQGPRGIKMRDRRWHLKWHNFCFEGVELVSFLLANFEDLSDRDSAVDLGNVLMGKGLFQHVQLKHRFRDGNFFYTLSPEYQMAGKESKGWFGSRKFASITSPTQTAADAPAHFFSPSLRPIRDEDLSMGRKGPRVLLSAAIKYDIDPRHKSDREEMIDLHYDRLHNPANAFHVMIEWDSATSKLIEEAISSWASMIERYGLRLVQLPMQEIGAIAQANPFRTPYVIKIALVPAEPHPQHTPSGPKPQDRFKHCQAILRRNGYILDYEASFRFPTNVDVSYTWADKAGFSKDQYIHVSGGLLVQIVDDETLILVANRLNTSRNPTLRREGRPGTAMSRSQGTAKSVIGSSPSLRPVRDFSSPPAEARPDKTLIQLVEEIEQFCANKAALAALYAEMARSQVAQTPHQKATRTPSLDANIPGLDLSQSVGSSGLGSTGLAMDPLTLDDEAATLATVVERDERD